MKNKNIILAIIIAGLLITGAIILSDRNNFNSPKIKENNVYMVDDKQIIEIDVKGGYSPLKSNAKAGIPAIIRFNTKGTFDCSSSVYIQSLGINKILPQTGSTDVDIGINQIGFLRGTCSMGMYDFEINFE
jgi:plastocyanin domain-containing protein